MSRSWTPVLVAGVSAGAVSAWLFWRHTRALKALDIQAQPAEPQPPKPQPQPNPQQPQEEDPVKAAVEPLQQPELEIDFCVEGELQQCEHVLGVVQCLRAEGTKNVSLDAALSALQELVPKYAAKLKEKRWLASKGTALLESTSEALQLLLLADDEQNLETAAKTGRDIPEVVFAAQALNKILNSGGCCGGGGGGCKSGGCGEKSGGGGCGSKSGDEKSGGGCCGGKSGGCGSKSAEGPATGGSCSDKRSGCGGCSKQGGCNEKSEAPETRVSTDGAVRLAA
ncbi:unnamed protein product [Symbiodinium necroappetens]|uniref:Uncharacterized protein n=1 Tax=Symbiodinium necroappetens TaxID=1628268 RepID=A0A813BQP6_9DINO|nr:unnamed protein product [Symbiodinium necroappetens]